QGREKKPQYRSVPVPPSVVDFFDLVFDLRRRQHKNNDQPFWTMSRTSAWRMVKKVMERAGISGPQATPKGLSMASGLPWSPAKILYPFTFWPISWGTLPRPQRKFIPGYLPAKSKKWF
ncbi:MAG: hypothetical protein M0P70_00490, partial [Desulfobulbaceae bacterium]|nr:hypothetical protein [Desulfobulbaceae bacterium]